jgi:hypothetical protein
MKGSTIEILKALTIEILLALILKALKISNLHPNKVWGRAYMTSITLETLT